MEGLAVILFPLLLMLFALSMERVETRLRRLTVEEDDVEQFFEQASPAEMDTFVREGFPRAIDGLRSDRRSRRHAPAQRAASASAASQR